MSMHRSDQGCEAPVTEEERQELFGMIGWARRRGVLSSATLTFADGDTYSVGAWGAIPLIHQRAPGPAKPETSS